MNFIICSYFTLGTPYQNVAHKYLMNSLSAIKDREFASDICAVPDRGTWQANTSYKPEFIKQMLKKHKGLNVTFLDADAEVMVYPELFENIPHEYHVAAHLLDRTKWYNHEIGESKELLSGTLFIRNTPIGHAIVNEWIHMCELYPHLWEQALLQRVLIEMEVKLYELPLAYAYINSLPDGSDPHVKCENPVIIHHQISRKLRNRKEK